MFRIHKPMFTMAVGAVVTLSLSGGQFLKSHCHSDTGSTSNKKVPGGDPLNCANPVCADKMSVFKMATEQLTRGPAKASSGNSSAKSSTTSSTASIAVSNAVTTTTSVNIQDQNQCPLDKNELGRSTWNLLHTMAAYYPEDPSDEMKQAAVAFIESLAKLYPCPHCAEDFREDIKKNPPRVRNRKEFVLWVCEHHNEVNAKLGKPTTVCSVKEMDERWKTGRLGCWNYQASLEDSDMVSAGSEKESFQ